MSSKIEICNMALGFLGDSPIADINENTPRAEVCKLYYDTALEQVLRSHPWNFAQQRERLVRVEMPDGLEREYSLAYAYPQKCINIHYLIDQAHRKSRRFGVYAGLTRPIVATDIENPVVAYTRRIDDATFYDHMFSQVLARRLQCLIVKPLLKNNPSLIKEAEELYRLELSTAQTADAREGRPFQDAQNVWDGGHDEGWCAAAQRGFK